MDEDFVIPSHLKLDPSMSLADTIKKISPQKRRQREKQNIPKFENTAFVEPQEN